MKQEADKKRIDVKINVTPTLPVLRKYPNKKFIDIRYSLVSPFANAHIYWDAKESELKYDVEEPILNNNEIENLNLVKSAMRELINLNVIVEKSHEELMDYIEKTLNLLIQEFNLKIAEESYGKIFYYLYRDFIGLDKVDPLFKDYFIEDIECNGVDTPIFIVHRMYRNIKTNIVFNDIDELADFVEKLAQRSGKYISYAEPILDGTLPEGSRVNATYTKDITSKGPTFTIRKFTRIPWTPIQLMSLNTISSDMLAYFWLLIQYKMNVLITGGTSSGKTTLLNAIAFFIPPEARVVSIEDTRELDLPRENWLPSVARTAIGTGQIGEVDLFSLLKSSFRQNPDYVIVGEVRGKEAYVLFQGMASGHSSISTVHADSVDTLIKRLETPPIELSPTLMNVLDCVAIMTHAVVRKQETRKLREIVEIINVDPKGIATTNKLFLWNPSNDRFYFKRNSKIFEKISARYGISMLELQEEFRKRSMLLNSLFRKKINGFNEVQKIINEYYKNPQDILNKFGII